MGNEKAHMGLAGKAERTADGGDWSALGKADRMIEADIGDFSVLGRAERTVPGSRHFAEHLLTNESGFEETVKAPSADDVADTSGCFPKHSLQDYIRSAKSARASSVEEIAARTAMLLRGLHEYDGSRKKIVIVDDVGFMALLQEDLILGLLGDHGFETEIITNPLKVIDRVRDGLAKEAALVILDQEMPGITGLELGKQLRTEADMQKVPFLISSGHEGFTIPGHHVARELDAMRNANIFHGFIAKPADKMDFVSGIISAVENALKMLMNLPQGV